MRTCFGLFVAALSIGLVAAPAVAQEYDNVVDWWNAYGYDYAGQPPIATFGDVMGSWSPGVTSVIGLAYDASNNSIWVANEGGGSVPEKDAGAGHGTLRSINVLGFGITGDGYTDGVAVDLANNRILLTDFQGDLVNFDDLIYEVDYTSLAMTNIWGTDSFSNTSRDGSNINTILGICVDGAGGVWASDNTALIHSINLYADGTWDHNFQQGVPGGGSWAGIDYDPCLDDFFVANFANNRLQYHADLTSNATQVAASPAASTTATTSNENGLLYSSGFGDNRIYELEGIECGGVATESVNWGAIKALW